jgi:methylmalonyl-CoA carboxyltransferase small subunit
MQRDEEIRVKYKLNIDGKTYEVDVEPMDPESRRPDAGRLPGVPTRVPAAAPAHLPTPVPAGGPPVDESKVCRSPIAGVVVRSSVQVGQSIQVNDVLLVLEAMKMETTITSPVAGVVAKVNVAVGDPVQGGQILVEFG